MLITQNAYGNTLLKALFFSIVVGLRNVILELFYLDPVSLRLEPRWVTLNSGSSLRILVMALQFPNSDC